MVHQLPALHFVLEVVLVVGGGVLSLLLLEAYLAFLCPVLYDGLETRLQVEGVDLLVVELYEELVVLPQVVLQDVVTLHLDDLLGMVQTLVRGHLALALLLETQHDLVLEVACKLIY